MFNAQRVASWIPKQVKYLIEEIHEDSEVVEVVLKDGYYNADEEGTIWLFGKDHYASGDYNLKEIREELKFWLDKVISIKTK